MEFRREGRPNEVTVPIRLGRRRIPIRVSVLEVRD